MNSQIRDYKVVKYLYSTGYLCRYEFLDTFILRYRKTVSKAKKGHGLKRDKSKDKPETWVWLPEIESNNVVGEFLLDDAGSECVIETEVGISITTGQVDEILSKWLMDKEVQRKLITKLAFNDIIVQDLKYI